MLKRPSYQKHVPVTMRDVAELAGVSQSTVSRVLSQSAVMVPISPETYKKVQDAVQQLGYHPNLLARSLRTQKNAMIAVMIADISNAFYHFIARAIQDIATQHSCDVLIANTDHLYQYEKRFCEAIMRRPVDGVIMVPYHLSNAEIGHLIERTGVHVAVLGQQIDLPTVDVVWADDGQATFEATNWLISGKSYRRLAFIGVTAAYESGQRRLAGFLRAVETAGLSVDPSFIQEGDFTVESGYRAMQTLLSTPTPPDVVVACNDLMAIGALNAAQDLNRRVPEEVAIIGFDNIPATTFVRPNLTTIAQFPAEIGRQLATALFERIEGVETSVGRRFEIPLTLIERQST